MRLACARSPVRFRCRPFFFALARTTATSPSSCHSSLLCGVLAWCAESILCSVIYFWQLLGTARTESARTVTCTEQMDIEHDQIIPANNSGCDREEQFNVQVSSDDLWPLNHTVRLRQQSIIQYLSSRTRTSVRGDPPLLLIRRAGTNPCLCACMVLVRNWQEAGT